MLKELEYPFDSDAILKKSKRLKRLLLEDGQARTEKKIAVLGGSTTHDILRILELFLLNQGIRPQFYESEYGQYWQDAMFPGEEFTDFAPDVIVIHTSNRNITRFPGWNDDAAAVDALLDREFDRLRVMWEKLEEQFHCPVIQNNFEFPFYRLLGNRDCWDIHGRTGFINRLNARISAYAAERQKFYINDIQYLSAQFGLDQWSDPLYWHMYKYALCMQAIPLYAFNVGNIIKSIFGKNKKALVLDLDNTLWGGVVGDDGPENLEIGPETSMGQVYSEFQNYIREQKEIGVMLNVNSKNEPENALAGLNHPDGALKPEDFILIKANWEPKSKNIMEIAQELNLLPDSLVFVDDNPAEREIVAAQTPGAAVPEIGTPEQYIRILDHSGFFEVTGLSEDDRKRNEMYKANLLRAKEQLSYGNYEDYLLSLDMKGTIRSFEPMVMSRIAQLTNKSNQFNLTTRRYTQNEIEQAAADGKRITLYGRLEDKFGDNGVVSVVIGRLEDRTLHVELWLMSCRVLKRDMEYAMMDRLVEECEKAGAEVILGYYRRTAKNAMVKDFYGLQGFTEIEENEQGDSVWEYRIPRPYVKKNKVIQVES